MKLVQEAMKFWQAKTSHVICCEDFLFFLLSDEVTSGAPVEPLRFRTAPLELLEPPAPLELLEPQEPPEPLESPELLEPARTFRGLKTIIAPRNRCYFVVGGSNS